MQNGDILVVLTATLSGNGVLDWQKLKVRGLNW